MAWELVPQSLSPSVSVSRAWMVALRGPPHYLTQRSLSRPGLARSENSASASFLDSFRTPQRTPVGCCQRLEEGVGDRKCPECSKICLSELCSPSNTGGGAQETEAQKRCMNVWDGKNLHVPTPSVVGLWPRHSVSDSFRVSGLQGLRTAVPCRGGVSTVAAYHWGQHDDLPNPCSKRIILGIFMCFVCRTETHFRGIYIEWPNKTFLNLFRIN